MSDIGSGIVGSFNQASLASRVAENEKNRVRGAEDERVRDARRRFIAAQEEVAQTESLRGTRVEPDKEESAGGDARDQYESHDEFEAQRQRVERARTPPRPQSHVDESKIEGDDSGHLIDITA